MRLLEGEGEASEGLAVLGSVNVPVSGHVVEAEVDDGVCVRMYVSVRVYVSVCVSVSVSVCVHPPTQTQTDLSASNSSSHTPLHTGEGGSERVYLVPITLEMSVQCVLRVSVGEPSAQGGEAVDLMQTYLMAFYVLLLFALYVGLKVYFADVRFGWTAPVGGEGARAEL